MDRREGYGIFDFGNFILRGEWEVLSCELNARKAASAFRGYVKAYISDHRPLWMELKATANP